MPTTNPVVLIAAKFAENVQTTQYTANNCKARIDTFTATNTSAGNVVFSINLVASGGSASASNRFVSLRQIAPNETYKCPEVILKQLNPGGFISTLCDTASALTIHANGVEITQ